MKFIIGSKRIIQTGGRRPFKLQRGSKFWTSGKSKSRTSETTNWYVAWNKIHMKSKNLSKESLLRMYSRENEMLLSHSCKMARPKLAARASRMCSREERDNSEGLMPSRSPRTLARERSCNRLNSTWVSCVPSTGFSGHSNSSTCTRTQTKVDLVR